MLSNKVAPILVFWFESMSGCADTVSPPCESHFPVYTHVLDEGLKTDLAASDCCRVNICQHAALDCRFKWSRRQEKNKVEKDERCCLFPTEPEQHNRSGRCHLVPKCKNSLNKFMQIVKDWVLTMASALEQISDSQQQIELGEPARGLWFKNGTEDRSTLGYFCLFSSAGFAELQTDMTDLTKELNRSQGIPFLEYKQFVTRTFFPKVRENSFFPPVIQISTGI